MCRIEAELTAAQTDEPVASVVLLYLSITHEGLAELDTGGGDACH
ncbi:MAG: hypothetical protein ACO3NR_01845 [Rhodothermales bacterium]